MDSFVQGQASGLSEFTRLMQLKQQREDRQRSLDLDTMDQVTRSMSNPQNWVGKQESDFAPLMDHYNQMARRWKQPEMQQIVDPRDDQMSQAFGAWTQRSLNGEFHGDDTLSKRSLDGILRAAAHGDMHYLQRYAMKNHIMAENQAAQAGAPTNNGAPMTSYDGPDGFLDHAARLFPAGMTLAEQQRESDQGMDASAYALSAAGVDPQQGIIQAKAEQERWLKSHPYMTPQDAQNEWNRRVEEGCKMHIASAGVAFQDEPTETNNTQLAVLKMAQDGVPDTPQNRQSYMQENMKGYNLTSALDNAYDEWILQLQDPKNVTLDPQGLLEKLVKRQFSLLSPGTPLNATDLQKYVGADMQRIVGNYETQQGRLLAANREGREAENQIAMQRHQLVMEDIAQRRADIADMNAARSDKRMEMLENTAQYKEDAQQMWGVVYDCAPGLYQELVSLPNKQAAEIIGLQYLAGASKENSAGLQYGQRTQAIDRAFAAIEAVKSGKSPTTVTTSQTSTDSEGNETRTTTKSVKGPKHGGTSPKLPLSASPRGRHSATSSLLPKGGLY